MLIVPRIRASGIDDDSYKSILLCAVSGCHELRGSCSDTSYHATIVVLSITKPQISPPGSFLALVEMLKQF